MVFSFDMDPLQTPPLEFWHLSKIFWFFFLSLPLVEMKVKKNFIDEDKNVRVYTEHDKNPKS